MADVGKVYPVRRGAPEPLWREVLGSRLRVLRGERGETLAQTAERAGISPQYLSEIERGRKEPSSEMIAALAGALGTTLADLTAAVTGELRQLAGSCTVVRLGGPAEPGPAEPGRALAPQPGRALAPPRAADLQALAA